MNRKTNRIQLITIFLIILTFSSCNRIFEREYYQENPHFEPQTQGADISGLRADSYVTLKANILKLVRAGSEQGVITIENYPGNIKVDLPKACSEISNEEPYGAYLVYYMSYELTNLVANSRATINITYKQEKIDNGLPVEISGQSGLKAAIEKSISENDAHLAVEMSYFDPSITDIPSIIKEIYYQQPENAFGIPQTTVQTYPNNKFRCIVEIDFSYFEVPELISSYKLSCDQVAESYVKSIPLDINDVEQLSFLHDSLIADISFDITTSEQIKFGTELTNVLSGTLYGALINNVAISEGYALAFKRICDQAEIPCTIVQGKKSGIVHYWNVVQINVDANDNWYHVDISSDDELETSEWLLRPSSDMENLYRWTTVIPDCNSPCPILQNDATAVH